MRQLRWKRKVIGTLTQEDLHGALQMLLERYNKCIEAGGDYFEGDQSSMCVLSIKVPRRKRSGNLSDAPRICQGRYIQKTLIPNLAIQVKQDVSKLQKKILPSTRCIRKNTFQERIVGIQTRSQQKYWMDKQHEERITSNRIKLK